MNAKSDSSCVVLLSSSQTWLCIVQSFLHFNCLALFHALLLLMIIIVRRKREFSREDSSWCNSSFSFKAKLVYLFPSSWLPSSEETFETHMSKVSADWLGFSVSFFGKRQVLPSEEEKIIYLALFTFRDEIPCDHGFLWNTSLVYDIKRTLVPSLHRNLCLKSSFLYL